MFGSRRRRKKKEEGGGASDAVGGGADLGEVAAEGCGCDLPIIALTLLAGASLLLVAR